MAVYNIVKLKNLSPIHIGTGRENYDSAASELHSDTLSSAIASMRALRGKTDDLKEFMESFTMSSAFPFFRDHLFLPRLQGRIDVVVNGQSEHEYRKKLKKVKYVDSTLYDKVLASETMELDPSQINGAFILGSPDNTALSLSKSQVNERVTVSRNDEDAVPFFFDWHFFNKEAGLYCIVKADNDIFGEIVELMEQLGIHGIGTDKNVGGGKFEVETGQIEIKEPNEVDAKVLLSLYIPAEEELNGIDLAQSCYQLMLRGGFMAGSNVEQFMHLRKENVYAFGVGSVLYTVGELVGKVVDLRPDWNDKAMHPVYRSGRAFSIPVKN